MDNYWIAHWTIQDNHYFHLSSQNWEVVIRNTLQFPAEDKAVSETVSAPP